MSTRTTMQLCCGLFILKGDIKMDFNILNSEQYDFIRTNFIWVTTLCFMFWWSHHTAQITKIDIRVLF